MSARESGDGASGPGLRERAERLWPVHADRPQPRRPGARGLL